MKADGHGTVFLHNLGFQSKAEFYWVPQVELQIDASNATKLLFN